MKKFLLIIAMALSLFTANAAMVTVTWAENHSASGGEFVLTDTLNIILPFNSFCLERNEYLNVGSTYSYQVSNATDGGIAGGINGGPDPVSLGTAWLYRNFLNGTLSGYTSTLSAHQTDLQNTIWYLEGELTALPNMGWLNLAQTTLGSVDLFSDANGLYDVGVWNLFDDNGGHAQSQLGAVPVPEAATWVTGLALLLPFGASTLRVLRPNKLFS